MPVSSRDCTNACGDGTQTCTISLDPSGTTQDEQGDLLEVNLDFSVMAPPPVGDPRIVNNGPIGLARFCTLRSRLSQWSLDDANADGIRAAADVSVPALQIYNSADNICTPSYARVVFDALASEDKQTHKIDGANHYYIGADQRPRLREAAAICTEWLARRGLASAQAEVL